MKRYLIAGGVGVMVFGAALGSAAALDINDPGVAQFGESYDLVCDENGVSVEGYKTEVDFGDTTSHGAVITGISPSCAGKWMVVEVTDASGNQLRKGAVQMDTSTEAEVSWAGVPFANIQGVQITMG
jgi:hypothetical protein